jgi:hypothetical protein
MGIMLEVTDNVIKNQNMPKDINLERLKIQTANATIVINPTKEKKVGNSKRDWDKG